MVSGEHCTIDFKLRPASHHELLLQKDDYFCQHSNSKKVGLGEKHNRNGQKKCCREAATQQLAAMFVWLWNREQRGVRPSDVSFTPRLIVLGIL